jgi:ABC-type tungstate transport system permease subunit
MILVTTYSTADIGLPDYLLPMFQKDIGKDTPEGRIVIMVSTIYIKSKGLRSNFCG